ncbi:NTE family protein [Variovorax sp. HW608]|uniref:patatin-like phospholipase family protein n=1 Tax=Variovorax sp. HW608 TaxID=1034889 RepID=UPI00081FB4D8|nr:patatin-like phospholipase family protein [Variovorax sp. HW608]SCK11167.1 NTE family protein [Variovorax sp. HW608]
MSEASSMPIALALSGGGVRAMVFHLGVLRRLAERGLLEHVTKVSTVSGGSLLVGLMLQETEMAWPGSEQFLQRTLPALREKLCATSLQWGALRQLRNPLNVRYVLSRSNLLALCLKNEWGIHRALSALPESPEWSINGTTAENGKRFRFKRSDIGDYNLGYAGASRFPLASALAVSAAFPGGFGPLRLDAKRFEWRKRPWDAPVGSEQPVKIEYESLHLYDGGVYDNLGLEPFFDAGRQRPKLEGHYLIASDAGAPLAKGFDHAQLSVFRLKRVADIMSDQARALRVRGFAGYLRTTPSGGAYIYIDTPVRDSRGEDSAPYVARFPTTLRRLQHSEFDRIFNHGYNVSLRVEREYGLFDAGVSNSGKGWK